MCKSWKTLSAMKWALRHRSITSWSPLALAEVKLIERLMRRRRRMVELRPLLAMPLHFFVLRSIKEKFSTRARSGRRAFGWEANLSATRDLQKLSL